MIHSFNDSQVWYKHTYRYISYDIISNLEECKGRFVIGGLPNTWRCRNCHLVLLVCGQETTGNINEAHIHYKREKTVEPLDSKTKPFEAPFFH